MEAAKRQESENVDEVWSDLIASVLSVNNYSIEKAYSCVPGLKAAGLCSPENLANWGIDEIARKLVGAGCNRGEFMMPLYAKRLIAIGQAVSTIGIEKFEEVLSSGDRTRISAMLMPINGIGPQVLSNFFLLREIR